MTLEDWHVILRRAQSPRSRSSGDRGVNHEVIRDLQIVDHRVEYLVDLADRSQQSGFREPIQHILFRLLLPASLALHGRELPGLIRVVVDLWLVDLTGCTNASVGEEGEPPVGGYRAASNFSFSRSSALIAS